MPLWPRCRFGLDVGVARFGPNHWALLQTAIQHQKTPLSGALSLSHPEYLKHQQTALKHNTAIASHFSAKRKPLSPHQRPNPLYGGCTQEPRVYLSAHIAPLVSPNRHHPLTEIPHGPANPLPKTSLAPPTTNPAHPSIAAHTHTYTAAIRPMYSE